MYIVDTGAMEALKIPPGAKRIPEKTIQLAEEFQRLESLIASKDGSGNGNGELHIKLKVVGGKLTRFFQLAGKWFPWG